MGGSIASSATSAVLKRKRNASWTRSSCVAWVLPQTPCNHWLLLEPPSHSQVPPRSYHQAAFCLRVESPKSTRDGFEPISLNGPDGLMQDGITLAQFQAAETVVRGRLETVESYEATVREQKKQTQGLQEEYNRLRAEQLA